MSEDETRTQPSGICTVGNHEWRHEPPGTGRLSCDRCGSMSMNNYGAVCGTNCADCHPQS